MAPEGGQPLPRRVVCADDTMPADTAYRLACEGTALLWRGDSQRAPAAAGHGPALGAQAPQGGQARGSDKPGRPQAFHLHRQAQGQRARVLAMLLIALEGDYAIALRRAPRLARRLHRSLGCCPR